jgi:putative transposase
VDGYRPARLDAQKRRSGRASKTAWATRKVLAWRLSNTMDAEFCIQALEEALSRFGAPEIFNTDEGSQFISPRFTEILKEAGVRIKMDGRDRWMHNVFIERL